MIGMGTISGARTKALFKGYRIRPLKRLGQIFLIDKGVIKRVIEAAQLSQNDIVLEIGPGIGNLTMELAKRVHPVKSSPSEVFAEGEQFNRVKKVIAVEKDPKLVEILGDTLRYFDNIKIIYGDILKIENWKLIENCKLEIGNSYKVVANLPFYLTAPVIRKFLESKNPPKEMTLIVQKEVAQRVYARPPDMNLLAVSVQFYSKPKIISYISKKSFWPQPKVDSAILRITQIHADTKTDSHRFFKIVRAGFSQPRKQLINNLSKGLGLERNKAEKWLLKNGIQPSQRAETLSIGDWINLLQSCRIK